MSTTTSVIIVGAGVGGLTLALCLERANIPFIVLEAKPDATFIGGSAFAIHTPSWSILDQLGVREKLSEYGSTADQLIYCDSRGKTLANIRLGIQTTRSGYAAMFLERTDLLQVLYTSLRNRDAVKFLHRVDRIEETEKGVSVVCNDSTTYYGQILVGADGVRSTVRKTLWSKLEPRPDANSPYADNVFTVDFCTLIGSSKIPPGFPKDTFAYHLNSGFCIFVVPNGEDCVSWIVTEKQKQQARPDDIPRRTAEDAEAFAQKYAHVPIAGGEIFGDLWTRRIHGRLWAPEEGFVDYPWTQGRIALMGDALHKVEPITGIGGNIAIQEAGALANAIKRIVDQYDCNSLSPWPTQTIQSALSQYEKERRGPGLQTCKAAWKQTRGQTAATWFGSLRYKYLVPLLGDWVQDPLSNITVSSQLLHFLPPPERRLQATMPPNMELSVLRNEPAGIRAIKAFPLILLSILAYVQCSEKSSIFSNGPWTNSPFLVDYGLIYSLMLIESSRRAMRMTFAHFPLLFGLWAQFSDPTIALPVYFFLFYVSGQISKFKAADHRLTDQSYSKSVLFTMLLCYFVPILCTIPLKSLTKDYDFKQQLFEGFNLKQLTNDLKLNQLIENIDFHKLAKDFDLGQLTKELNLTQYTKEMDLSKLTKDLSSAKLWRYFPITATILQRTIRRFGLVADTVDEDRLTRPYADVPLLFWQVMLLLGASTIHWGFVSSSFYLNMDLTSFQHLDQLIKSPSFLFYASPILWILYLIYDLKRAGMIERSWVMILYSSLIIGVSMGPGSLVAIGWLWREHALATKKHRSAITSESWRKIYARDFGLKVVEPDNALKA